MEFFARARLWRDQIRILRQASKNALKGSKAEKSTQNAVAPCAGDVFFDMEFDLQEDVVAELEQFILRSRLGLTDECIQMFDEVLRPYRQFFPIFAEYAAFLIETKDWRRLSELIEGTDIAHFSPDEKELVLLLQLFAEKYGQTVTNLDASLKDLDERLPVLNTFLSTGCSSLSDMTNSVQLQIIETYWKLRENNGGIPEREMPLLRDHYQTALQSGQLWEAQMSYKMIIRCEHNTTVQNQLQCSQLGFEAYRRVVGSTSKEDKEFESTNLLAFISMTNTHAYQSQRALNPNLDRLEHCPASERLEFSRLLDLVFDDKYSDTQVMLEESVQMLIATVPKLEELLSFLPYQGGSVFEEWHTPVLRLQRSTCIIHQALCRYHASYGDKSLALGTPGDPSLHTQPEDTPLNHHLNILKAAQTMLNGVRTMVFSPAYELSKVSEKDPQKRIQPSLAGDANLSEREEEIHQLHSKTAGRYHEADQTLRPPPDPPDAEEKKETARKKQNLFSKMFSKSTAKSPEQDRGPAQTSRQHRHQDLWRRSLTQARDDRLAEEAQRAGDQNDRQPRRPLEARRRNYYIEHVDERAQSTWRPAPRAQISDSSSRGVGHRDPRVVNTYTHYRRSADPDTSTRRAPSSYR